MTPLLPFIVPPLLAAGIAFLAYRRGSLSRSGAWAAFGLGTLVFGLGGWAWAWLLVGFFVTSSAWSHFKRARKAALAEKFSKGTQRDWAQVAANGGIGAMCVVGNVLWPHPLWWLAYAGTMATVNADTWATELGVLSRTAPRLITTGREVPVGTSGGLTVAGTLAALGGAAFIAGSAALLTFSSPLTALIQFVILTLAGLFGALFDSLLGATVQAIYHCDHCQQETERHPLHTCGHPTRQMRGWRWLDNDWVNALSAVVGAGIGVMSYWLLGMGY